MLHCIALHCIVLYVLYCIVLYCIALYCIALHCIVLYCFVLYCIALHCIVTLTHEESYILDHDHVRSVNLITMHVYVRPTLVGQLTIGHGCLHVPSVVPDICGAGGLQASEQLGGTKGWCWRCQPGLQESLRDDPRYERL